ncbi:AEC family transporter [Chelatococcus asaccharovorans]|nr:AEC family transporter [Chelatococcus asaccharovorans]MBS7705687.1 AEC family transporter [Chelatococcus asaccharovorans]
MMTDAILLALAPIFFVLLLGYGAGRYQIVDNHKVDSLNALVMNFALPASLFAATASASRSEMVAQAPLFALFGIVMLAIFFVWYLGSKLILKEAPANASLQALTLAFPNLAGVGLPIMSAVVGPSGGIPLAIALASGSILVSPLSLIIVEMSLNPGSAGAETPAVRILRSIWHALTKPVVLAPALGILISLAGLKTDAVLDACLLLIGHAAPGVALFLTGLILSSQAFRLDWRIVRATVVADIVRPLLAAAIVFSLPIPHETARVVVLLAAIPSGFFGILFAVNYRQDSGAAGSMVTASTVFSIVTMAIVIALLFPS